MYGLDENERDLPRSHRLEHNRISSLPRRCSSPTARARSRETPALRSLVFWGRLCQGHSPESRGAGASFKSLGNSPTYREKLWLTGGTVLIEHIPFWLHTLWFENEDSIQSPSALLRCMHREAWCDRWKVRSRIIPDNMHSVIPVHCRGFARTRATGFWHRELGSLLEQRQYSFFPFLVMHTLSDDQWSCVLAGRVITVYHN